MQSIIEQIVDDGGVFWIVGGTIAVVAIVFGVLGSTIRATSREKTRREIAAYIAEGSISPEQGEKLMQAAPKDQCD